MGFFSGILGAAAPIIGGAVGGPLGSLLGAGLTGVSSAMDAREAQQGVNAQNALSIASAREQMAFQERMSNTAHQREIRDLRKAGLNPILSARYGGSSTPGGAMPSIQNAQAPATQAMFQRQLQSAQIADLQAGTALKASEAMLAKNRAETELATANEIRTRTENLPLIATEISTRVEKLFEETKLVRNQTKIAIQNAIRAEVEAGTATTESIIRKIELELLKARIPAAKIEQGIDESFWGEITRILSRLRGIPTPPVSIRVPK